jgi:Icc protein
MRKGEEDMSDYIEKNLDQDGVDRRGFLKCMAWAGTGTLCVLQGGVLKSFALSDVLRQKIGKISGDLSFVQISDSHIGFNKEANPDVTATLREAIAKVNALPTPPAFVLHTGDLTQLSKPEEFDTLAESLKSLKTGRIFYVPGEHDVLSDNGEMFRERFGQGTQGDGWYSFDQNGAHFIGLVNVLNLKAGGLGNLGSAQLEWLEKDVSGLKSSTPIVVFAHIPLWAVYPQWGWGTDDSEQALSYLRRFGSVTVLNGHIHQTMQKVEGNITFHTACSTAFPQPQPGMAASPGPMKVPAEKLRDVLGITDVNFVRGKHTLGITDSSLA